MPISPANSNSAPALAPAEGGKPLSFEAAMERLETIVEQMENARLPLEELIRVYEEGTGLIKVCSDRLNTAEQRIEMITRDAAGQPRVSEYQPPAGNGPAAANLPPAPAAGRPAAPAAKAPPESPNPPPPGGRPAKTQNEVSLF